jgi:citrate lyase subunit beta / citryl-CoA lyase
MNSHLHRTALYVPAANAKAVSKSDSLDADAVILDLEDSVAPEAKSGASAAVAELRPSSRLRIVRVNAAGTPWHEDDIAAGVKAAPHALLLPKASSPEDIWAFRRLIMLQRPKSAIAVWAMIETPLGVLNAASIAQALGHDGVLVLGLNDLAKETGMAQIRGRAPMLSVLTGSVIAARASGVGILDGVFNDLADDAAFAAECAQARAFGFDGKTVIHPRQIGPANSVFSPSPEDIADARAVIEAFARPENASRGVIALSGRMVERLHLDMAIALVAKAAAIAARES